MRKYYRLIDTSPTVEDNVATLLGMGAVHYSTMHGQDAIYRNFVILFDEDELIIAKLSLNNVSIDPLADETYNFLKTSGYIR